MGVCFGGGGVELRVVLVVTRHLLVSQPFKSWVNIRNYRWCYIKVIGGGVGFPGAFCEAVSELLFD